MRHPDPRGFGPRPGQAPVATLACVLIAGIVLGYAGLLAMGQWQGDEYVLIQFYRDSGIHAYIDRVFGRSPRPVSELIFWLYAIAVELDHRAHIVPFLAILWTAIAVASVATIRQSVYRGALRYRLLLSLSVLAMLLLGHPVSELFYWPVGAAAYLPTIAAILFCFFLPLDRPQATAMRRLAGTAALFVAAGSSEIGTFFVLCLSAVRLPGVLGERPRRTAALLHWAIPVALSLVVLAGLLSARAAIREVSAPQAFYLHRPLASLLAAIPQTLRDFAILDGEGAGEINARSMVIALLVRLLFFVGFRWTWQATGNANEQVGSALGFALACFAAAYFVRVATDYQFGGFCCERHAALRQCFFALSVAALAVWSTERPPRVPSSVAPLPLVLAALIPFANNGLGSLVHDYRLYRAAVATRSWNWREGMRRDTDVMVFENAPVGRICHGGGVPPGKFVLGNDAPWWARAIMQFFGKRAIDIRPPPVQ